jgi:GT2 family glycosyltransferase
MLPRIFFPSNVKNKVRSSEVISRIAALMTSHNRRDVTMSSLESLFSQENVERLELVVFLVDDGSTDGTAEAVTARFPQVRLLRGDGSLFWNGGTRKAFEAAMQEEYDAYLLFNDDSELYSDSLARIVTCSEERESLGEHAIVTGSMRSPGTGERSYGGLRKRTSGLRMYFEPVMPDPSQALPCDTMNGNFALIPKSIARGIGNLEPTFTHKWGDFDYGLRATQANFAVVVAPGFHGECSKNSITTTYLDRSISRSERWERLMSPKGVPWREWLLYVRRHFGWRWPMYAVSPYIKTLFGR